MLLPRVNGRARKIGCSILCMILLHSNAGLSAFFRLAACGPPGCFSRVAGRLAHRPPHEPRPLGGGRRRRRAATRRPPSQPAQPLEAGGAPTRAPGRVAARLPLPGSARPRRGCRRSRRPLSRRVVPAHLFTNRARCARRHAARTYEIRPAAVLWARSPESHA